MLKMSVQGMMSYTTSQQIRAVLEPLSPQVVEYDDYRTMYMCVNGSEDTVEQIVELAPRSLIIAAWTDDTQIAGWIVSRGVLTSSLCMPMPMEPNYYEMESDEEATYRERIALVVGERLEFCFQTLRQMRSLCRVYD